MEHLGVCTTFPSPSVPRKSSKIGVHLENPRKIQVKYAALKKKNMFTKNRKIKMLDVHTTFTSIRNGRHFGDAKCAAIEKNLRPGVDDES